MQTVSFAPWEPDKALLSAGHSVEARGVLPVASGYGPFPSLSPMGDIPALPGTYKGSYSFFDAEGNPVTIVGTANNLYRLFQKNWDQIGGPYHDAHRFWSFARYGDYIIAVNGVDKPQYATVSGGDVSQFQEIADAPVGSSVEVVKEFIILGGVDKTKIQWSAIGNPLDWPTPGSNDAQYKQADEQDFPDTGSLTAVSGALPGVDLVLFTERAVHRGQYIGSPFIFQFDIIDKSRGAMSPQSVVSGRNAIYYLSEEGFLATNGSTISNISAERVTLWFRSHCDPTRRKEVRGALDPISGFIVWTFPGMTAKKDIHDFFLVYHPMLDRWSYGKLESLGIFAQLTHGYVLEELDAFGPLDTLPYSLDHPFWKGGFLNLAAFTPDNILGLFSGLPMEATIDTEETGGKRMMVHGIRPLVDGGNKAEAAILYRDFQHARPVMVECDKPSKFNGVCYTHVSTRYARGRVIMRYGTTWTHAIGCDVLTEEEGAI